MPVYTYRREDGTLFDHKQRFLDEPLAICPTTGQKVVRIIQKPNVIFKGSGFYVNDSKDASKQSANGTGTNGNGTTNGNGSHSTETSTTSTTDSKAEASQPTAESGSVKQLTPIPTKD